MQMEQLLYEASEQVMAASQVHSPSAARPLKARSDMGSKLTRQRSLDLESRWSKRRRQRNDAPGEGDRSGGGDFLFTSLMLRSDKLPGMMRRSSRSPYVRRVAWIREIQRLLREQRMEQATEVLRLLRKDLGLQGTSLNDILYKNAAFLNLVDPISHELLLSLARDLQCPKREKESLKSTNKICRQLLYHLTPHSKWTRQSVPRRKSQAWIVMKTASNHLKHFTDPNIIKVCSMKTDLLKHEAELTSRREQSGI
ncbi:unnamed protein product [Pleuronectes platessa]|uniref:Uncharacterized protein n=1 Tax=Pleuronectes platessa TaxID=8262 RepID=A0A9N7Z2T2_PLEPL|nr:unnamed protein product [Pleuronectes platessa]